MSQRTEKDREVSQDVVGLWRLAAALVLMAANVVVIELGRRGLWHGSGAGFSPWYPVLFSIAHLLFWPTKLLAARPERWWGVAVDVVLMASFVLYNLIDLGEIMYVS